MLSNTTQFVYDFIKDNPDALTADIVKHTGLNADSVSRHVRILRGQNLIYVSKWIPNAKNVPTMRLSSGNKLDAEKPPLKEQTIVKQEKKLKIHTSFRPKPDEAAAWLLNPIIPNSLDMSAR